MELKLQKPSESGGLGPKITELEGALCVFTYRDRVETATRQFGVKLTAVVDVDVIEGAKAGTRSKMPPQTFGEQPGTLEDYTGQSFKEMRVFGGFLNGVFRGAQPGDMVLGRIAVEGKVTSVSANDKDLKASWVMLDATQAETAQALAWLEKKKAAEAKELFKAPSGDSAPADEGTPDF